MHWRRWAASKINKIPERAAAVVSEKIDQNGRVKSAKPPRRQFLLVSYRTKLGSERIFVSMC